MNLTRRQALLGGVSGAAALTMLSAPARAAAAVVTHGIDFQITSGPLTSTTYNTTGANALALFVYNYPPVSSTVSDNPGVTDSLGNIWLGPFYPTVNAGGSYNVYVCVNARVGTGYTYTVRGGAAVSLTEAAFVAISGVDQFYPLATGGSAANGGGATTSISLTSGTQSSSPALNTFDNGDLILSFLECGQSGATQACAGFATLDRIASPGGGAAIASAFLVQSSAGSVNPTWSWTGSQSFAATISLAFSTVSPKVVTWSVAGSGGDVAFSNSDTTVLDTVAGPDNTYFSLGKTCTGGSSTTMIVDPTETAASLVGHPLELNRTGDICIVKSVTNISGVITATVGAVVGSPGYASAFSSVPLTGDAYTVFPNQRVFSIGASSSGHTTWAMNPTVAAGSNRGMADISPIGSQAYQTRVTSVLGSAGWAYDAANGVGTPIDGSSQICVQCAGTPEVAVFFLWTDNVWFDNLYIRSINGSGSSDGIFNTNQGRLNNSGFTRCCLRGENFNLADNHFPMSTGGLGGQTGMGMRYNVCGLIGTSRICQSMSDLAYIGRHCTIVCTDSTILTATAGSSGTTVNVVSTASVYLDAASQYPGYLGHPAIPLGFGGPGNFDVISITSTSLTIRNAITGTINPGDLIVLSMAGTLSGYGGNSDVGLFGFEQCATFGYVSPLSNLDTTTASVTLVNNASDYASGASGFTLMSYAAQFNAAFGVGNGTVDIRPKVGNGLSIGTADPNFTTDLVGNAYAGTNPSVGALQFQSAAPPGKATFLHAGPF